MHHSEYYANSDTLCFQIKRVDKQISAFRTSIKGGDEHTARAAILDLLHCREILIRGIGIESEEASLLTRYLCPASTTPLRSEAPAGSAAPRNGTDSGTDPLHTSAPASAAAQRYPTAEAIAAAGAFNIGADDPFRADWPHW